MIPSLARIRSRLVVTALGALVGLLACSSSGGGNATCDSVNGACPNRAAPTASDLADCQSLVGDPTCGAAFQRYFDCALRQEKCTAAGVTDDAATKTAVATNCASEVSAYQACTGPSSSTTPPVQCGADGEACCATGSACSGAACCNPATNRCVGSGASCSNGGVCSAGQCAACGGPGEPCCSASTASACQTGGCCDSATTPQAGTCVVDGDRCQAASTSSLTLVCHAGGCTTCGGSGQMCCPGSTCPVSATPCTAGTCQ